MPYPWLAACASVVALFGLVLAWASWWPHRRGAVPYYRRCAYNLTSIDLAADGARCPECGAVLSRGRTVVHGARPRHAGRALLGVVILLAGLGGAGASAYQIARRVRWYSYYPLSWILPDYYRTGTMSEIKARSEIDHRLATDKFSEREIERLIEIFLEEQARPELHHQVAGSAIRQLGEYLRSGRLSEAQRRRFLEQCIFTRVHARDPFIAGGRWPIIIDWQPRLPPGIESSVAFVIDLADYPDGMRFNAQGRIVGIVNHHFDPSFSEPAYAAGPHKTRLRFEGNIIDSETKELLLAVRREFPISGTAIDAAPEDLVAVRRDPELEPAVRVFVGTPEVSVSPYGARVVLKPTGRTPVALAFEVTVVLPDRKLIAGDFHFLPGVEYFSVATALQERDVTLPEAVTVMLHSNPRAAYRQAMIDEVWEGELRFDGIRVAPP